MYNVCIHILGPGEYYNDNDGLATVIINKGKPLSNNATSTTSSNGENTSTSNKIPIIKNPDTIAILKRGRSTYL